MTWWSWLLAGALGGSGTVGLVWKFWPKPSLKPEVVVVEEKIGKEQLDIEKKILRSRAWLRSCEIIMMGHGI